MPGSDKPSTNLTTPVNPLAEPYSRGRSEAAAAQAVISQVNSNEIQETVAEVIKTYRMAGVSAGTLYVNERFLAVLYHKELDFAAVEIGFSIIM